jgi:hypothetical protein
MSQSVHWAKNRKTWVIVFGAFFILIASSERFWVTDPIIGPIS